MSDELDPMKIAIEMIIREEVEKLKSQIGIPSIIEKTTPAGEKIVSEIQKGQIIKTVSPPPVDYKDYTLTGFFKFLEFPGKNYPYKVIQGKLLSAIIIAEDYDYYVTIKKDGEEHDSGHFWDYHSKTLADGLMARETTLKFRENNQLVSKTVYVFSISNIWFVKNIEITLATEKAVRFKRIFANLEALVLAPIIEE